MLTLSSCDKLKGTIKAEPSDFVVEEITENGTVLETNRRYTNTDLGREASETGEFSVFVLQKSNWNTLQALRAVAKKLSKGVRSTGFAGTKDRMSVSTQLCSVFGATPEQLEPIHIKDIAINGAWRSSTGITMGQLIGNRFIISVRDAKGGSDISEINEELGGMFPNYFGEQRFGFRDNNVKIGLLILQGDFKAAVMEFLTDTSNENRQEAVEARKNLAENQDYKEALKNFPTYLKYERLVLEYLSKSPTNYANAIRAMPRQLSLMFVHSVESKIFNKELEHRVKDRTMIPSKGDLVCVKNTYGFPDLDKVERLSYEDSGKEMFLVGNMVGHNTKHLTEIEDQIMEDMDITVDSFKVNGLRELSCKGTYRALFAPYKELSYSQEDDIIKFAFSLPSGSYATILLNEFIENPKI